MAPFTAWAHADAEAAGSDDLAKALAARVPQSWPPEFVAPPTSEAGSWAHCYLVHAGSGEEPILIGMAGAARWPAERRTIQVGATVVPEFYGKRIGEEVVGALAEWALRQPDVDQVVCDVPADHAASAKSLERAGYVRSAAAPKVGYSRFVRKR